MHSPLPAGVGVGRSSASASHSRLAVVGFQEVGSGGKEKGIVLSKRLSFPRVVVSSFPQKSLSGFDVYYPDCFVNQDDRPDKCPIDTWCAAFD